MVRTSLHRSRFRPSLVVLSVSALLVATTGCASRRAMGRGGAAVAASLSVERFLQAANDRDLDTMSRVFGTAAGPIGDTGSTFGCFFRKIGSWFGGDACVKHSEVELRLDTIALVLKHDDYRIVGEEPVAGRSHPTTRILVDLVVGEDTVPAVPFVVVRSDDGHWLVQQVDLTKITSR